MSIRRWFNKLIGRDVATVVQTKVECLMMGNRYGGYCVATKDLSKNSVSYSVGIGEDISFDLALIHQIGITVDAFDPTPKSLAFIDSQKVPSTFRMHPWGVAHFDGVTKFNPPRKKGHVSYSLVHSYQSSSPAIEAQVFRLETIMSKLGHSRIDILKMDIEGAEYTVLEDILNSRVDVGQILIEFHHRFKGMGLHRTQKAVEQLNHAGYRIFHIADKGDQYSFIRIG
jgi:FkbM family methyltransferase